MIKKYGLSVILYLLTGAYSFGQITSAEMQRRKHLLSTEKTDTGKIKMLASVAAGYRFYHIDSALFYSEKALALARKDGLHVYEAAYLSDEGSIYLESGDIPRALSCLLQGLDILDKTPNDFNSARFRGGIENRIGNVYMELGEYPTSILHYRLSLAVFRKFNKTGVCNELSNIGNDYELMGKLDSASIYQQKAFEMSTKLRTTMFNNVVFAEMRERLGNIATDLGDYNGALLHYRKGIKEAILTNDLRNLSVLNQKMAGVFEKMHLRDSSFYYAKKTLAVSRQVSMKKSIYQAAGILSGFFEVKHQPDSALFYARLSANVKDDLYGPKIFRQLQLITLKEQRRQQQLQEENDQLRYKYLISAMVAALCVFLLIAIILYRNNRQKQKANRLLTGQKQEIETQRDELESKNSELEVEASLERVRTVAMAMNKADDMLDVCKTIAQQLAQLGVMEIRNVQTAIFYPERGTYMNYEHYLKHDKNIITETTYGNNERHAEFAAQMQKGYGGEMELQLKKEELEDWIAYQKTTNVFIDTFLETAPSLNYYWYSLGPVALGITTYQPLVEAEKTLFRRFLKVFELSYTRYLDIEQATTQAREAQIQLALERVRARAMAMQTSEELSGLVATLIAELGKLDMALSWCLITILNEEAWSAQVWRANSQQDHEPQCYNLPFADHPFQQAIMKAWKERQEKWSYVLKGDEKVATDDYMFSKTDYHKLPQQVQAGIRAADPAYFYFSFSNFGGLQIGGPKQLGTESLDILARFGKVFDLTYTRFNDLKQAEAQAREAQIQLAIERVRAKSMAMQHSDGLGEVIRLVLDLLTGLGLYVDSANFVLEPHRKTDKMNTWIASPGQLYPTLIALPYFDHPINNAVLNAGAREGGFWSDSYPFEEKNNFFTYFFQNVEVPADRQKMIMDAPGYSRSVAFMSNIALSVTNYANVIYSDHENAIIRRFAGAFEEAYIRFLDLQKAEEQAREAQIQLALERVRARTMAMQNSHELSETVFVLFQQFKALGENPDQATIGIFNEDERVIEYWVTMHGNQNNNVYKFSIDEPNVTRKIYDAWKAQQRSLAIDLTGKPLLEFMEYRAGMGGAPVNPDEKRRIINVAIFSKGLINVQSTSERSEESIRLLERFAAVFEQTYTRFLDLLKAETQARDAKVEASLERVRASAMAMHKTDDLMDVGELLYKELTGLSVTCLSTTYSLVAEDEMSARYYGINPVDGKMTPEPYNFSHTETAVMREILDAWRKQDPCHIIELDEQETLIHQTWVGEAILRLLRKHDPNTGFTVEAFLDVSPKKIVLYTFNFPKGYLFIVRDGRLTAEQEDVAARFTKVFDLTYRRFLDLKQAEEQAREAQIEAALEKVRSRTLAMQRSEELAETAAVLFRQMISLGIEPNRLYIGIARDETMDIEFWITDEDGSKVSTMFSGDSGKNRSMKKMWDAWKAHERSLVIDMRGKELADYFRYLGEELHVPFKGGLAQTRRIQYISFFSNGFIGIASPDEQPQATIDLLDRFAYVFNLTFARFNDLKLAEMHALQAAEDLVKLQTEKKRAEDALTDLRAAQKQLVQAEKMASLGELTAGIAHEIQNPLNFVNNFSEVSVELLQELKEEAESGNSEDVIAIANDLTQNLEKIRHHGKRADGIVKGMLEHSRTSTGQMEPTELNQLADEYLRLAYHGLRAKDKSFNAELVTHYDENLPLARAISQDMGRVLLNLFNNAFYAVNQRAKTAATGYNPQVEVTTSSAEGQVIIEVKDNGIGMPGHVKDKIMQPFFTTKPTGEGTGLGLSLTYDMVVKGHGGRIEVNSVEGEGSIFTIILPLNG